jgi:hypothetical protein
MKKIVTLFAGIVITGALFAQTFNSPESVEYDAAGNRWFVSQNGSGQIHYYSPGSGTLTQLGTTTLASGPHGIEILGTTIYACDGNAIKGFDLATGAQVFNLNLGATFLNGLTTDGGHFLFATDFTGKKIYRINTLTSTSNVMCSTIKTPNGIYYDGANNRCVFVTWGANAPIQAMSLGDSTVTTLLATSMGSCDGITRDAAGYWYVTAWTGNQLWRIDPAFSSAPVSVMTGLSSPADIDINAAGDSIGIPNSGSANNVVFYTNITTTIVDPSIVETKVFPVPSSGDVTVNFANPLNNAQAEVYDLSGKQISAESFSGTNYTVNRNSLAVGKYIVVFRTNDGVILSRNEIIFN